MPKILRKIRLGQCREVKGKRPERSYWLDIPGLGSPAACVIMAKPHGAHAAAGGQSSHARTFGAEWGHLTKRRKLYAIQAADSFVRLFGA
jgi:hypothetical protein